MYSDSLASAGMAAANVAASKMIDFYMDMDLGRDNRHVVFTQWGIASSEKACGVIGIFEILSIIVCWS